MRIGQGPIDAVYTWVDGGRADYRAVLSRYRDLPADDNPERTRDDLELLRYSLRSVRKFAPWLGNVILFTCRPQVPDWLDTGNPRVKVVHHDEVIGPEFLPTFNSRAIESHLHLLPTSSDTFLYMNDDYLFGAPTTLEDFYRDGRLQVMGTLFGERLPFRIYEERFAFYSFGLGHTPLLVHKPYWTAMLDGYAAEVRRTRAHRFRRPDSLSLDRLYAYYHLSRPEIPARAVPIWELYRFHRFHKLLDDYAGQCRQLEALRRAAPKFYCLNDDLGPAPDRRVGLRVREMLEEWYPEMSEFEK